jgi:hypothetical protein
MSNAAMLVLDAGSDPDSDVSEDLRQSLTKTLWFVHDLLAVALPGFEEAPDQGDGGTAAYEHLRALEAIATAGLLRFGNDRDLALLGEQV